MGCAYAGYYGAAYEAAEENDEPTPPRELLLRSGDRLFAVGAERALPASLIGVRPARHLLLWEGYFRAAEALVEICEANPKEALRLVYPILFAYRHAVEVGFKYIIDFYGDEDAPGTHDLLTIWSKVRVIVEYHCYSIETEEIDALEAIVGELAGADPGSTSFRYTWRRRAFAPEVYETQDYPQDRDDVPIDLAVVRDVMARVQELLDEVDFDLMNCGFDPRD